jgi:phospholipid/cholesterol/gamma-HCH transport system ATP-binding protein
MIEFQNVHKSFGTKTVLEGFSLSIPDRETTVIIGYSGSGKSVALKHVVGLILPDSGQVEVDGQPVGQLGKDELTELRRKVGYVFQFAALFDSMTVAENIALGLARRGLSESEIERRVADSLALVDLPDTQARYPAELSGGMRKRVPGRRIRLLPHPDRRSILRERSRRGRDGCELGEARRAHHRRRHAGRSA